MSEKSIMKAEINSIDFKGKDPAQLVQLVGSSYRNNGLDPNLELAFIQFKLKENPQLMKAANVNPESLYNSILQAAESGLSFNPQWQECYFVPYNQKVDGKDVPTVTFSPMYRGKKKLLISKGICKNITTELVYEGEAFNEEIINGVHQIEHKPNSFARSDHSKIVGGYAVITLMNDEKQYVVKGRDYFDRCKKASEQKMYGKTSPAWKMWYDQMCHKCLVNEADSIIPKIGVASDAVKLLNDVNTSPEKQAIDTQVFEKLISDLETYKISLAAAREKYKGFVFTDEQKKQIIEAGTITDAKISDIVEMAVKDSDVLKQMEFILTPEQLEMVKEAVVEIHMSKPE